MNTNRIRLSSIQMLRGFAALAVLLLHISNHIDFYFKKQFVWGAFAGGWSGVDIFFVLSGFIIMFIHFDDLRHQSNIKSFFLKRFNRIFPIFWVVLFIYGALEIAINRSISLEFMTNFIKNFFLVKAPATDKIIVVSWSLTYEVIFYIIFGACILLGSAKSKILWGTWFVLVFVANIFFENYPIFLSNYLIEFLLGVGIGYLFKEITLSDQKYVWIQRHYLAILLFGVSIFLIAWVCAAFGQVHYFRKHSLESRLGFGTGAALMILGLAVLECKKSLSISSRLILLGDASYVLYLLHPLCLTLCFRMASRVTYFANSTALCLLLAFFAFVMSVSVAIIFHLYVEKPLLKRLNKTTRKISLVSQGA
jgi:exopolysaccharide production protein ExoZ